MAENGNNQRKNALREQLIKKVLEHSESQDWDYVRLNEWYNTKEYKKKKAHCQCGHCIRDVRYIKHIISGKKLKIGNCCIELFLNEEMTKINREINKEKAKENRESLREYCLHCKKSLQNIKVHNDSEKHKNNVKIYEARQQQLSINPYISLQQLQYQLNQVNKIIQEQPQQEIITDQNIVECKDCNMKFNNGGLKWKVICVGCWKRKKGIL